MGVKMGGVLWAVSVGVVACPHVVKDKHVVLFFKF